MTINEVAKWIAEHSGVDFEVKFTKRGLAELRHMKCKTGVKDFVNPDASRPATDFKGNGLIGVYDTEKLGYRCFPLEGVREIMIDGSWINVTHPAMI